MNLLEYLVIGSYLYTTAVLAFLYQLVKNHLVHRIQRIEQHLKLDPLTEDDLDE